MRTRQDIYSGWLKLCGNQHKDTLLAANNYAAALVNLERFEEAKSLLRKAIPVARRISGDGDENTLSMRWSYAEALYKDDGATLDDLRETVTTLEDMQRNARRVLGGTHPMTAGIGHYLQKAQAALLTRQGLDVSAVSAALDAMKAT